jgi:hypothetical protein
MWKVKPLVSSERFDKGLGLFLSGEEPPWPPTKPIKAALLFLPILKFWLRCQDISILSITFAYTPKHPTIPLNSSITEISLERLITPLLATVKGIPCFLYKNNGMRACQCVLTSLY